MSALWMLLLIGISAAVLMLAASWARRDHYGELGTVSHHWMAEHRQGQNQHLGR